MKLRVALVAAVLVAASCGGDDPDTSTVRTDPPVTDTEATNGPVESPDATDAASSPATPGPPSFEVVVELDEPIDLRQRPGTDTIYVASRQGTISAIDGDEPADDPLLDISGATNADGEQGLLGFTFSPDGALVYVHYTDREGTSTVAEYALDGDRADTDTRRVLLTQPQPFPNHNGGSITFGPDQMLYIGLGDGGSAGDPQGNGQAVDTLLGKLLRIDPATDGDGPYAIPADNPFAISGGRPEIYAWGLRNPWRFSFDRATGDLWIGDVGQNEVEEINRSTVAEGAGNGANFGWRAFEGNAVYDPDTDAPGAVAPVVTATHSGDGACSITGGFVYHGPAQPSLAGAYLFSDLCWTGVRAWTPEGGLVDLGGGMGRIVSFGEDLDGHLYVLSFDGTVYRLV